MTLPALSLTSLLCCALSAQAQTTQAELCAAPALPVNDPELLAQFVPERAVASRASAMAVEGDITAQAAGPELDCLALQHGAPLISQGMSRMRSNLSAQALRLHHLRLLRWPHQAPLAAHVSVSTDALDDRTAGPLKIDTTALTVGADYRISEAWVAGASLGISRTRARWLGTSSRVDGDGAQLSAYASWSPTPQAYVSATGSVEAANHSVSSQAGTGLNASTRVSGHTSGLSLSAGYDFAIGSGSISPYARIDHVRSSLGALSSAHSSTDGRSSAISAGLQAQTAIAQTWGVLAPHARVEITRLSSWRVSGDSAQAYMNATGLLPAPNPVDVDRQFGQFGLGVSGILQRGMSLFADYDQGFGMRGVSQWRFNVGLRSEL